MFESLSLFHLVEPLWLLALVPLLLIYLYLKKQRTSGSGWSKIIDAHLLPVLITKQRGQSSRSFPSLIRLLMLAWLISVVALANPVWQKKPIPIFQTNSARVVVLDLSRSMLIKDLKPSRLARARFKVEDILEKEEEGQIGLVVFAGDAFTVTPLTRDVDTISAMLPSLHPMMMPVQGSRADLGLLKAGELLSQAGVRQAQIILIADGAEDSALDATQTLRQQGYSVSVLSIGTKEGASIPNVRDREGNSIVVGMEEAILKEIAKVGGGQYSRLRSGNQDVDSLLSLQANSDNSLGDNIQNNNDQQSQGWVSEGPWLVLLLLPLAALAFRRGWLLSVGLLVITLGQPQPVRASIWDSLWDRQDQQADLALKSGDFDKAQHLAESPLRKGSAAYKKGDYKQALNEFSQLNNADGLYNKGNTLAYLNKLPEAIKAYDEALKLRPDMADAKANKAKLEELLKKEKEKKKEKGKGDNKDKDKDKDKDKKDQKDKDSEGEQDSEDKKGDKQQEDSKQSGKDNQDDKKDAEKNDSSEQDKKESDENQFAKANEDKDKDKDKKEEEKGESSQQQEKESQEQEAKEEEEATANGKKTDEKDKKEAENKASQAAVKADELNKEEKLSAEQWLRRIPEDPGGLLKRKFRYQYNRRNQQPGTGGQRPW